MGTTHGQPMGTTHGQALMLTFRKNSKEKPAKKDFKD